MTKYKSKRRRLAYVLDVSYRMTRSGGKINTALETDALIDDCVRNYGGSSCDSAGTFLSDTPVRDRQYILEGSTPQTRSCLRLALRRLDVKWDYISMQPETHE